MPLLHIWDMLYGIFIVGLKWGIGVDYSCFFGNHGRKCYVISVVLDTPFKHNRMSQKPFKT